MPPGLVGPPAFWLLAQCSSVFSHLPLSCPGLVSPLTCTLMNIPTSPAASSRVRPGTTLPSPSPVLNKCLVHCNLWYKETAQNLFCKTGSVPPSLEWAYQNLWLFSNLPPSTDTVILKKPNLCKYVTMYAFQGISTFIIQADPLETMCSRCGIVILSFIDIIKAQTFAVASLSSHGKAKLEQKLAPRPPASSLYSESQLCQDACLLQGDSHASSWHTSLQLLFNYIRHPCAHLQASFFQEWLRRKWELTVIDGLFHFLLTWLWSQSPF